MNFVMGGPTGAGSTSPYIRAQLQQYFNSYQQWRIALLTWKFKRVTEMPQTAGTAAMIGVGTLSSGTFLNHPRLFAFYDGNRVLPGSYATLPTDYWMSSGNQFRLLPASGAKFSSRPAVTMQDDLIGTQSQVLTGQQVVETPWFNTTAFNMAWNPMPCAIGALPFAGATVVGSVSAGNTVSILSSVGIDYDVEITACCEFRWAVPNSVSSLDMQSTVSVNFNQPASLATDTNVTVSTLTFLEAP